MIQHRLNYKPEPAEPRWWDALLFISFILGCYALAQMWDALP